MTDDCEEFTCPDCDGEGWVQETDCEDHCCGGSDWECGARGCTGPVQEMIPIQVQCERCLGTGDVRARDSGSGPEGENSRSEVEGEAPQSGLSEGEGIALNPSEAA